MILLIEQGAKGDSGVVLLRSPALIAAAFVYSWALALFGVESSFGEMLGVLPLVFFGAATHGPMRAVAISMWVLLFPDRPAEMTAFAPRPADSPAAWRRA